MQLCRALTLWVLNSAGINSTDLEDLLGEVEAECECLVAFRRYTFCRSMIAPMRSFGEMTEAPDITTQIEAVVAGFLAGLSEGRPKELPQ